MISNSTSSASTIKSLIASTSTTTTKITSTTMHVSTSTIIFSSALTTTLSILTIISTSIIISSPASTSISWIETASPVSSENVPESIILSCLKMTTRTFDTYPVTSNRNAYSNSCVFDNNLNSNISLANYYAFNFESGKCYNCNCLCIILVVLAVVLFISAVIIIAIRLRFNQDFILFRKIKTKFNNFEFFSQFDSSKIITLSVVRPVILDKYNSFNNSDGNRIKKIESTKKVLST